MVKMSKMCDYLLELEPSSRILNGLRNTENTESPVRRKLQTVSERGDEYMY